MVLPSKTDNSREKFTVHLYDHKMTGIIPADCQREKHGGEKGTEEVMDVGRLQRPTDGQADSHVVQPTTNRLAFLCIYAQRPSIPMCLCLL